MSKEAEGNNRSRRAINIGILLRSKKARREQCFAYSSCLQAGFNLSRICGFFPPTMAKRGKKKIEFS